MLNMNIANERDQPQRHSSYNFNVQPTQWSQVTPQYMPWGHTPSSPAAPLVTFTATSQNNEHPGSSGSHFRPSLISHCKRKAEVDIAASATKQHITEEKMAAHMSRLHISTETPQEQSTSAIIESTQTRQQRLYVCEEMRRLQTESILPSVLLGRIERPCMAVMLWQPPPKVPDILPPALAAVMANSSNNNNNNDIDNNNSSTVDLNNMDMDT